MVILIYFLLYLFVFIFGICIGSFLNVVIYRMPKGIMMSSERSYCPVCGEKIKNYDLIPVLSFILLKGKCRACRNKISIRYPLVELLVGFIAVLMFYKYYFTLKALIAFAFCSLLVCVSLILMDNEKVPVILDVLSILICTASVILSHGFCTPDRKYAMIAAVFLVVVSAFVKKTNISEILFYSGLISFISGASHFVIYICALVICCFICMAVAKLVCKKAVNTFMYNMLYTAFIITILCGDFILSNINFI